MDDTADEVPAITPLRVRVRDEPERRVLLELEGELDLSTVRMFVDALDEVFDREPAAVVVDLSGLRFIDSSGVGAYVAAYRRGRARGTRLSVGDRSPFVERVLQISGVEEALEAESA